jgi:hypothetical protein
VKFGGLFPDINPLSEANQIAMVKSFEPFVIHNTLEIVIEDGFSYSISHLIKGVIGQGLFIPSLFGVRSSEWNVQFQDFLGVDLGYGIAYSYIGQAYSIGGIYCVVAFAFLYAFFIVYVNNLSSKMNGSLRILLVIFGAVCGIFIYRNSMENIIAIFRQILISYLLVRGVVVVINNINVGSDKYESV